MTEIPEYEQYDDSPSADTGTDITAVANALAVRGDNSASPGHVHEGHPRVWTGLDDPRWTDPAHTTVNEAIRLGDIWVEIDYPQWPGWDGVESGDALIINVFNGDGWTPAGGGGPQGPIGPQGPPGQDGATGATGATGPKGDPGDQGPAGSPVGEGPDPYQALPGELWWDSDYPDINYITEEEADLRYEPKSGGSATTYTHVQSVAAATWTVAHNLGYNPSLTVVDSSGQQVHGAVTYVDTNTITVGFAGAMGGTAYCS